MPDLAERLAARPEELDDLPSLPPAVAALLTVTDRPDASLGEVAEVVRTDPGLAAQVLRVANSAAWGGRVPVATLREALLPLGLWEVRRLALVLTLYNSLYPAGHLLDHDACWRHSLGVAQAMEALARLAAASGHPEEPDHAYLAGLLHEVGLLALAIHYPQEYLAVRRCAEACERPFAECEREVLGLTHGRLGALMASRWRLADPVVAAIGAHGDLEACPAEHRRLARLLQLGEAVCREAGIEAPWEAREEGLEAGAPDLGLTAEALAGVVARAQAGLARSTALLQAAR
jgi:HD-like signal output (HDOD) protein